MRQHISQKFWMLIILVSSGFCYSAEPLSVIWLFERQQQVDAFHNNQQVSIGSDTTNLMLSEMRLRGVELSFYLAPGASATALLSSQKDVCSSNRNKTKEREQQSLYGLPVNLYPSIRLFYSAKHHPLHERTLNQFGEIVSLKTLFDVYPDALPGKVSGRTYGNFLDAEIAGLNRKNIMVHQGFNQYVTISNLLLNEKLNFGLFYPTKFQKIMMAAKADKTVYTATIAGIEPYILGHVVCTKTETGQQVIALANQVLKSLYSKDEFYQAHARYLSENQHDWLKEHYAQVFIRGK